MEPITFHSQGVQLSGVLRETSDTRGRAVVFCHSAFEFQDDWFPYAERLAQDGFTTFTFDFSGHGNSQGTHSLVEMHIWAYNLRDALNELTRRGYRRYGLVGWGSGGTAALLAAAHDPRIACVISLAAPVSLMPRIGERFAYGLASLVSGVKKMIWKRPLTFSRLNELEDLELVSNGELNAQLITDPRRHASMQAVPIPESLHSVWMDITRSLNNVKIPVLVLHGKVDRVIPYKQSERLFTLLSGPKEHYCLENSGHALHLDHESDQVYRLIMKWLKHHLK